jgi:hypothetical protein
MREAGVSVSPVSPDGRQASVEWNVEQLRPDEMDAFLAEQHRLVIGTIRRDGRAFWIATNRDRVKYRNIQRDSRVALLIDAPLRETSVAVRGRAEVVAIDEGAYAGALAIVERYVCDAAAYLEERRDEQRVLLRIVPEYMTSWRP